MIAVIQRVSHGQVTIAGKVAGRISGGLVILLGVAEHDERHDARWLADKIADLRIFEDKHEKMNRSLKDVHGAVLVISQFTLISDYKKGRRPSFTRAARPEKAIPLYEYFKACLSEAGIHVEAGEFGAMMQVDIRNEGPVTMVLDSEVKYPRGI